VIEKWLVDTHCHLDFNVFDVDRADIIRRAKEANVIRIINPGVDIATSKKALELSEVFPEIFTAAGIHPNELDTFEVLKDGELKSLLSHPKVVAIGEIGLDYYWNKSPKDLQRKAFEFQLKIASEAGLPVIVHNREATQDIIAILNSWDSDVKTNYPNLAKCPGVLHSFSGTIEDALHMVELGFLIGITGPVTFKKAIELQNLVRVVPLESLLIETDAPFLTPHPVRGKRNEPSYVKFIADKIAELRGISYEQVAEVTTKNAFRLFRWREIF
jgi:TatD DNase family protein